MTDHTRSEVKRRTLNIMEALIVAALLALGAMIFWMRDAVVQLTTTVNYQADELKQLRSEFAGVALLTQRVSTLEANARGQERIDKSQDDAIKELRDNRGLK